MRLMIRHRQGGVIMAQGAVDRADTSQVRTLAQSIVTNQQYEITQMQQMLAARGES